MKRKLAVFLTAVVVSMGLLLGTSTAQTTTVEKDADVATAIRDLHIGSLTYDVTFPVTSSADTYGPFPGGFDFNTEEEAQIATEAVAAVLNDDGGVMGIGPSAANGRQIFRVPFGSVEIPIGPGLIKFKVPTLFVWEGVTGDTENPGVWAVPEISDLFPYSADSGFAKFTLVAEGSEGNSPPVADAGGPYTGSVGVPVHMSGTGSSDLDGSVVSYSWSFGDGASASGETRDHTYDNNRIYNVTLTVTDDREVSASDSTTAEIGSVSAPPVADAGGPYHGTVGAPLTFDGTGSSHPDGSIASYSWSFGDLSPLGTGAEPTHTYDESGTYSVGLEVTDDDGQTALDYTTADIAYGNLPPEADAGGPYHGIVGAPLTFDGTGSSDQDGHIALYRWGFGDTGDSNTGTGAEPTHTYYETGTYSVYLTVDDDDGATDSNGTTVVIGLPPPCACDLNTDGGCDKSDWLLFFPDFGRTDCNESGVEPCECDLNDDGRCNFDDLLLFISDWGRLYCPVPDN